MVLVAARTGLTGYVQWEPLAAFANVSEAVEYIERLEKSNGKRNVWWCYL